MVVKDEAVGTVTLLTLEELTERVAMSVRNIRFYTTKGLVPPPIRRGRSGYYTADHVARLQLVQELQGHGFTLSAIERYVVGIPAGASPEDIALHRAMLAPWMADSWEELSRVELDQRAGRTLSASDLETLAALGVVQAAGRGGSGCRCRSSASGWGCSTSATRSRPPAPPRRCTPSTVARSRRSSTSCSGPRCGRSTRSKASPPRRSRRSWSASSRCRSPPWCRPTRPAWTSCAVPTSPSAPDEASAPTSGVRGGVSSPDRTATILVTGATGFIGRRLVPALLDREYDVRAMTRRPEKYDGPGTAVGGDVHDPESLTPALAGVDVAYYLVHSLDAKDFEHRDARAAEAFGRAAAAAGTRQIVYLGGLGAEDGDLSAHLRSRREVEGLLGRSGVPVTVLRAGIVIGRGGISWELTRQLVKNLPAMVVPRWVSTSTQPIAVDDVIRYLVGVADEPRALERIFEIGGPPPPTPPEGPQGGPPGPSGRARALLRGP